MNPDLVRNAKVARVCNKGDNIKKTQLTTGIVTAVAAVATVVFLATLLLHRKPVRTSAWRRHGLALGVDPAARGQGLSLRMGCRF